MTFAQLIQAVYHEPALITPAGHASIRQLLESRFGETLDQQLAERKPGTDFCGQKVEVAQPFVDQSGIAHIPIGGALGQDLKPFERGNGAVDTLDIRAELAEYASDTRVRGALLDIDSPGGMVLGTPETAEAVREFAARKPIHAFTRGMMASAAYWIGSAATGVWATPSASVGSIGVVLPFLDQSRRLADAGVKVDVIKAGKYKGIGIPGTALSDDQREHLTQRVAAIHESFKTAVRTNRAAWGAIADSTMEGQTFMGTEAARLGLIDAVVKDKREVLALFG